MTQTLVNTTETETISSTQDIIIKCAGLTKVFRDFWLRNRVRAVDNIDLEIRSGQVYGLLGPNGSGKSTTIKMILGLLNPTAGRIAIFGKRPEDVAIKKQIGYLPEESYLYRFLNARETLDYYGRLFHQNGVQRRRRIDMLLEMVGLDAVQRRPVGEYSKGMQRRIGLAQALINDPQLLILDEPTTGLDPIGTRQIKDIIVSLARRGKTVLLCSHLLGDVEDVCDRVAIMFGGKIRAEGTVDDLLTKRDVTAIETGALDDDTIRRVDELLREQGKMINRVERPRQRLESLFLDIVEQAQKEGVATSGARAGGRIAQFLVDGEAAVESGKAQAEAVIQSLVTKPQGEPPASVEPAKVAESRDQTQRQTQQVLSQLTAAKPAAKPAPVADATAAEPKLAANLDVIQGLVQPASKPKSTSAPTAADAANQRPIQKPNQKPNQKPAEKVTQKAPSPAPAQSRPPKAPQPAPPPAAATKARGEAPDEGFLAALEGVPEFDEQQDATQRADGKSGEK